MLQGQIGFLETRPNRSDCEPRSMWVIKLRDGEEGQTVFCGLGDDHSIICENQVDHSKSHKCFPSRPYFIRSILSPLETARMIRPDNDLMSKLAGQHVIDVCKSELSKQSEYIRHRIAQLNEEISSLMQQAYLIKTQSDDLKSVQEKFDKNERCRFCYAYGYHLNDPDRIEYCWRIPSSLIPFINEGQTVFADSAGRVQQVVISRLESSGELKPHKMVVSVAK